MAPKYCTPGPVRGIVLRIVQISRHQWQPSVLPPSGEGSVATLQLAELHLWCADLDEPGGELASDELLDESERQRAAAIADPVMRARSAPMANRPCTRSRLRALTCISM